MLSLRNNRVKIFKLKVKSQPCFLEYNINNPGYNVDILTKTFSVSIFYSHLTVAPHLTSTKHSDAFSALTSAIIWLFYHPPSIPHPSHPALHSASQKQLLTPFTSPLPAFSAYISSSETEGSPVDLCCSSKQDTHPLLAMYSVSAPSSGSLY